MICPCRVKLSFTLSIAAVVVAALSTASFGNVYPTALSQSTSTVNTGSAESVTLGYILNDAASDVTLQVLNSSNAVVRTFAVGAQAKGSQSLVWDGKNDSNVILPNGTYSFRVSTTGSANAAWTQISTDSTFNNFEVPHGVAVNKNPNSPFYGRVYITSATASSTAAGRAMADGVYMVNADFTDTGIAGGTGPYTGNVPWDQLTGTGGIESVSPFRIEVGPDSNVYVTDWSDDNAGLYQAPPNLTGTWVDALDNTGRAASGLNGTHGSIADVVITGTGANRVIHTIDEDLAPTIPSPGDFNASGQVDAADYVMWRKGQSPNPNSMSDYNLWRANFGKTNQTGTTGSIVKYNIGTATTFTGAPSGADYLDGTGTGNKVQNFEDSIALANDGTWWISQRRDGNLADTLSSLIQVDPNTNAVLWSSIPSLAANTGNDPLRTTRGMAYDPINNLIALAQVGNAIVGGTTIPGGTITIFDPATKTVLSTFTFGGGSTNTDIGFDNVGNLYASNRSAEFVRVWTPPNGVNGTKTYLDNLFSTDSLGPLGSITLSGTPALGDGATVPEPASCALVVLGLAFVVGGRHIRKT